MIRYTYKTDLKYEDSRKLIYQAKLNQPTQNYRTKHINQTNNIKTTYFFNMINIPYHKLISTLPKVSIVHLTI